MVVPLVSEVENKNLPYPEWNTHPYGPNELKVNAVLVGRRNFCFDILCN